MPGYPNSIFSKLSLKKSEPGGAFIIADMGEIIDFCQCNKKLKAVLYMYYWQSILMCAETADIISWVSLCRSWQKLSVCLL